MCPKVSSIHSLKSTNLQIQQLKEIDPDSSSMFHESQWIEILAQWVEINKSHWVELESISSQNFKNFGSLPDKFFFIKNQDTFFLKRKPFPKWLGV